MIRKLTNSVYIYTYVYMTLFFLLRRIYDLTNKKTTHHPNMNSMARSHASLSSGQFES